MPPATGGPANGSRPRCRAHRGHNPAVAVAQRTSASAVAEMAFLAEKARDDGPAESEVRPLRLERELGGGA